MKKPESDHQLDKDERSGALNRRDFVRLGAAGVGAAMLGGTSACASASGPLTGAGRVPRLGAAPNQFFASPPMETVRIGFVGVGGQGTSHVQNLSRIEGARIAAVCDIRPEHAENARDIIVKAGHPTPTLYTRGERDFERMCAEEDLDLVFNATPWEWHVPICLSAMQNGKHAATEVPAAINIDGCWALVEAAEKYGKHCVLMENCNYDRPEMLVLNLVRQGAFGEILHGEAGYLHDLRSIKFADEGEGLWRRAWATREDANFYPTHGLGPVANCMNINRGNRFEYLVSMSSPSRGLQIWAEEHYPPDHPKRQEKYVLGDVNTSLIKTSQGQTIFVSMATNLPRPYSRIHMVQGTRGLFHGYPNRIYIEGRSPQEDAWQDPTDYYGEFDHPLWKQVGEAEEEVGHGGMDYLEDARLIYCLRHGLPTDMNVYDAVSLSAVVGLTQQSNANGSQPVEFPDFTRGKWQSWTWPEGSAFGALESTVPFRG